MAGKHEEDFSLRHLDLCEVIDLIEHMLCFEEVLIRQWSGWAYIKSCNVRRDAGH
jgi:hypothetical protein